MPTPATTTPLPPDSWGEFEAIVVDVIRKSWGDPHAKRWGRQGQEQHGIDVLCEPEHLDGGRCVVQCKNVEKLTIGKIEDEVEDAENSDLDIHEFVVTTTLSRDNNLQEAVEKLSDERKSDGKFPVRILMWEDIWERLTDHQGLVEKHYGEFFDTKDGLEEQGIHRLTLEYFDRLPEHDVKICWRTGFNLREVKAGHTVERQPGEFESSITEELIEVLRRSENKVVLGPPGSGKSTILKSVAVRWYEEDFGTVFYRESGESQPFQDTDGMADLLEYTEGHVLVVVEDAASPEAERVFEVVDRFRNDPQVMFLLDARNTDWKQFESRVSDPILSRARNREVSKYEVPKLTSEECEDIVAHFEEVTYQDLNKSGSRIYDDIETDSGVGEMLLLAYQLSLYSSSDSTDPAGESGITILETDVRKKYKHLKNEGEDELPLKLGMLVSLLSAADRDVHRGWLHAFGSTDAEHRRIEDALELLEGQLIFTENEYQCQTNHGFWSLLFLRHLIFDQGAPSARSLFEECVNAVFSLIDDDEHRKSIERWFSSENVFSSNLASEDEGFADKFVMQVFDVGSRMPALAPLFGTTSESGIELPSSSSPVAGIHCVNQRGLMFLNRGDVHGDKTDFERAKGEIQHVREIAEEVGTEAEGGKYVAATALGNLGLVFRNQGDFEAAAEYHEKSLQIEREIGNRAGEAKSLGNLGLVAQSQGDFEAAAEYHEKSLGIKREIGDRAGEARSLGNLGLVAQSQGDFEAAKNHFQTALQIEREIGDRAGEARSLGNLGLAYLSQNSLPKAQTNLERGARQLIELGILHEGERLIRPLVLVCEELEDYDDAVDWCETGLRIADELRDEELYRELGVQYAQLSGRDVTESTRELYYHALGHLLEGSEGAGRLLEKAWERRSELDKDLDSYPFTISAGVYIAGLLSAVDEPPEEIEADLDDTLAEIDPERDRLSDVVNSLYERLTEGDTDVIPEELRERVDESESRESDELPIAEMELQATAIMLELLDHLESDN